MAPLDRLIEFYRETDPEVERGLLLVCALLRPGAPPAAEALAVLDELAEGVVEHTPEGVAAHLFDAAGFAGDVDDYHSPDNSFLDSVLERRRGMPITLAATLVAVARRCGVTLHGVGMPGHFLVGIDDRPGRYLDPFAGGVMLDVGGAEQRFRSIAGTGVAFDRRMLRPVTSQEIVSRVLNNLTRSFAERDRRRLDGLVDVRAALPVPSADLELTVGLAESRARWDLAADLRERIDPDDSRIIHLRSRLN